VKQGYRLIVVDKDGVLVSEFQLTEQALAAPEAFVAVIFGDDTTSTFDRAFPDAAAATLFADGMRAGLQWAQNLEQPLKAAAQGALDILNEVDRHRRWPGHGPRRVLHRPLQDLAHRRIDPARFGGLHFCPLL
jgi:hypothetical protein